MVMRKSRSFTSTSLARGEVVGALAEQAAERNTAKRRTRGRPRCKPSCRIPPTSAKKGFYVRARGFMDERSRADVRDRGVVRGCYARFLAFSDQPLSGVARRDHHRVVRRLRPHVRWALYTRSPGVPQDQQRLEE